MLLTSLSGQIVILANSVIPPNKDKSKTNRIITNEKNTADARVVIMCYCHTF